MAYAPKDPALMAKFIERCATRYKNRVRVWEFLNEPVHTTYALPSTKHKLPGAAHAGLRFASTSVGHATCHHGRSHAGFRFASTSRPCHPVASS